MPRVERLGTTISLVMLGLVVSAVIYLPVREIGLRVFGSQLSLGASGLTQMAIVMVGLACSGADAVIAAHPANRRRSFAYAPVFWALPALLALASLVVVRELAWWEYRVPFIVLSGALLGLVVTSQYHTIDPADPRGRVSHLILNILVYALAFFFFIFIYGSRLRSAISATGVLAVSGALALELLRGSRQAIGRTWLFASLTGLVLGELTWVLNYSGLGARTGGAVLLVTFYVITGLMQQELWGRLTRRVAVEYVGLGAAALVVVLAAFGGS